MARFSCKRIFDLILAISGLFLLLPLCSLVAMLIWLKLGRPIFFSQQRAGLGGKPLRLYKFRTMTEARGADDELLSDRERLTPLGSFLRRTSLDELPELYSVIKGDLSLVGPRPLYMRYLPYYTEREKLRHSVKPGITGLAQIHGRNYLPWDQRLALDVWYVENRSMRLDLSILLKTLVKVATQEGVSADSDEVESDLELERTERKITETLTEKPSPSGFPSEGGHP